MQLLRTLAIIFIIYYGFKLLARYVFPFLLKRWMNKKMGQFNGQAQFENEQKAKDYVKQHEGEVKIKTKRSSKTETDNIGDFVDYEEVDE